jgi:hypothetical protein
MSEFYAVHIEGSPEPSSQTPAATADDFEAAMADAAQRSRETDRNHVVRVSTREGTRIICTLAGGETVWPRLATPAVDLQHGRPAADGDVTEAEVAGVIEPAGDGYTVRPAGGEPVTVADVSEALELLGGQEPGPSPYDLGETDDPDLTWTQVARLDAEARDSETEIEAG